MLTDPVTLPGSLTFTHRKAGCYKCGTERTLSGGVDLGPQKFICAGCWRSRATRSQGALAALKASRKSAG